MPQLPTRGTRGGRAAQSGGRGLCRAGARGHPAAVNYVLGVVSSASALFFAGMSTKLTSPKLRPAIGCAVFLLARNLDRDLARQRHRLTRRQARAEQRSTETPVVSASPRLRVGSPGRDAGPGLPLNAIRARRGPKWDLSARATRPRDLLELGDLDRQRERPRDIARRRSDPRMPTIGATVHLVTFDFELPAARRLSPSHRGTHTTATSAAKRTSIDVYESRSDASIESAVMFASKSRTGVSLVAITVSLQVTLTLDGVLPVKRWARSPSSAWLHGLVAVRPRVTPDRR